MPFETILFFLFIISLQLWLLYRIGKDSISLLELETRLESIEKEALQLAKENSRLIKELKGRIQLLLEEDSHDEGNE